MTNIQVLEKVLKKVIWENKNGLLFRLPFLSEYSVNSLPEIRFDDVNNKFVIIFYHHRCPLLVLSLYDLVFDLDYGFAKAFWGCEEIVDRYTMEAWEYHLQQISLEKDTLKYLQKFI